MQKDFQYYVDGVRLGNRVVLSKTITLLESSLPKHQELAQKIIDYMLPFTGNSIRLGISGVPGVGKSTFIESFGMYLVKKGHKLAVLAIDPSSIKSGGSILADKTRMEKLSNENNAFIRPSPSGKTHGGVAKKTREAILICEAAGFDVIIIETVGVGQIETAVASMVDFFLLLLLAGAGDELQGIKKGILELADAVCINKADGDNFINAKKAKQIYENAIHLLKPSYTAWTVPVLTCSAVEFTGIKEIWEIILEHNNRLSGTGELDMKRKSQSLNWMYSLIEEGLKERFYSNLEIKKLLDKFTIDVKNGVVSATSAANTLINLNRGLSG